jgi:hypothetical protein
MIVTKRVKTITEKVNVANFTSIHVMSWHKKDTPYYVFSPYHLRTDGEEECQNSGNIIFENFWQGSKVYDYVEDIEVYPHKKLQGQIKHLSWKYVCNGGREYHLVNGEVTENYKKWRNSLFSCDKPVRYPNGYAGRMRCQFSLLITSDRNIRLNYIEARKRIYVQEYCRLVRKLPEYLQLLNKVRSGENICICEIDVPSKEKKGYYNNVDENGLYYADLVTLNQLLNDPSEPFGHGLCLCLALLEDK